jgi:signal transduction histidine kinase
MDRGGGTLTLTTEAMDGTVRVRIADTGCGMSSEVAGHIFEPFFTTKGPGKGTGLGLYNVKTIVSRMLGTITVDSREGKGTTISIDFPPPREVPP